ncbi:aminoglycoside phosphotransferase [Williamsia sp. Leaf354]|uniref:aminoglycoside 3'-phosphotransferase n=1 Tax=Williamsia sp. Leaf354 TaxID=1736349 RepID=UPI0006F1F3EF|nr:aminoglycoside 3'-phosphotransferase [Williamsia sp. Leaf354]KQR98637.1 aminoglycoside phosphotransferase [Williamsia sp. Leaf354]
MTAAVPDHPVPGTVVAIADGASITPVWHNGIGGTTYELAGNPPRRFLKWQPWNREVSVADEVAKLAWARAFVVVPRVLDHGSTADAEWIVTEALDGRSAVAPEWIGSPEVAVSAVGRGLRQMHDALPVAQCGWAWGVKERLEQARARGLTLPEDLDDPPSVDRLVVCHGDACAPNSILASDGTPAGHVDLGSLGTADRWADLAVAAASTEWNYGPGWRHRLIEAYGLEPDERRISYYERLWNHT